MESLAPSRERLTAQATQRCPISLYAGQNTNWRELKDHLIALNGVTVLVVRVDPATLRKVREEGVHEWVDQLIWVPVINGIPPEDLYLKADAVSWVAARRQEIILAGFALGQVWLHLHNETAIVKAVVDWEVAAVRAGLIFGMKFAVIGSSVGTPTVEQMKLYKPLLAIAVETPDSVGLSLHLYFSVLPQRKADLYSGRWRDWVKVADQLGLAGRLDIVATEYGAENISDDHEWTRTLPGGGQDGFGPVHTLGAAWNQLLGTGKGLAAQYGALIIEGWTQVLEPVEDVGRVTGRVRGAAVFGVGLDSLWDDYDVWKLGTAYREAIVKFNQEQEPVADKITTLKQPAGEIGNPTKVKTLLTRNLRFGPEDGTYDVVRTVQTGTEMVIYKDAAVHSDPPFVWYFTGDGWMAENTTGSARVFEMVIEPEPEDPPPLLPEDWHDQVREMLREIVVEEMQQATQMMFEVVKAMTATTGREAEALTAAFGIWKETQDRIEKLIKGETT